MRFINLNGQTYNLDKLVSFRFEPVYLFGDESDDRFRGRWIVNFQDSAPVHVSHSGVNLSGSLFAEWLMKSSFTVSLADENTPEQYGSSTSGGK